MFLFSLPLLFLNVKPFSSTISLNWEITFDDYDIIAETEALMDRITSIYLEISYTDYSKGKEEALKRAISYATKFSDTLNRKIRRYFIPIIPQNIVNFFCAGSS